MKFKTSHSQKKLQWTLCKICINLPFYYKNKNNKKMFLKNPEIYEEKKKLIEL